MKAAQQQRLLAAGLAIARALLLLAVMLLWPGNRVRAFELAAHLASVQTGQATPSAVSATPLLAGGG